MNIGNKNVKILISSVVGAIFITMFTASIGIPTEVISLGAVNWTNAFMNFIFWVIVTFVLIKVFIRYKLPF